MYVTVIAVLCKLAVAHHTIEPSGDCTPEEYRREQVVTDTDKDARVDLFACQMGSQIAIADWKQHHPTFFGAQWRVAKIKCVPGHYFPKDAI
jgi:hypothetical protein